MSPGNDQEEKETESGECIVFAITPHSCPHTEDEAELQAGKGTRPTVHGKQVAGPQQVLGVLSSWRVGTQEPDCRLWRLAAGEEAVTPPEHTLQTWSLSDT